MSENFHVIITSNNQHVLLENIHKIQTQICKGSAGARKLC